MTKSKVYSHSNFYIYQEPYFYVQEKKKPGNFFWLMSFTKVNPCSIFNFLFDFLPSSTENWFAEFNAILLKKLLVPTIVSIFIYNSGLARALARRHVTTIFDRLKATYLRLRAQSKKPDYQRAFKQKGEYHPDEQNLLHSFLSFWLRKRAEETFKK